MQLSIRELFDILNMFFIGLIAASSSFLFSEVWSWRNAEPVFTLKRYRERQANPLLCRFWFLEAYVVIYGLVTFGVLCEVAHVWWFGYYGLLFLLLISLVLNASIIFVRLLRIRQYAFLVTLLRLKKLKL